MAILVFDLQEFKVLEINMVDHAEVGACMLERVTVVLVNLGRLVLC